MRKYKMSPPTYKRLKTMKGELKCHRCGELIKIGETVISTEYRKRTRLKLYHLKCWEEMKV